MPGGQETTRLEQIGVKVVRWSISDGRYGLATVRTPFENPKLTEGTEGIDFDQFDRQSAG